MPVQVGELTSQVDVRGQAEGGHGGGEPAEGTWDRAEQQQRIEAELRRGRERVAAGGFGG